MRLSHGERLSLEIGSRMEIELGSPSSRLKSRLVGMESGAYLIARLPETDGFQDDLRPGMEVKVRFECSGNLYGFESTIIDFYSRSLPLLILTYPKAVDRHELRTHPRVDCFFPATARMEASEFQGSVTDISLGGCRYVSRQMTEEDIQRLALEKKLVVYIKFPGDQLSQAVKGQVRSVRHDGEKAILGLQFEDPGPDLVEKLSDFIDATAFLLK
jgi:c-di-GMP-binding flagellar brake protein YcgR